MARMDDRGARCSFKKFLVSIPASLNHLAHKLNSRTYFSTLNVFSD